MSALQAFAQALSNAANKPVMGKPAKAVKDSSESAHLPQHLLQSADSELFLSFGYLWREDELKSAQAPSQSHQSRYFILHPLFNPFAPAEREGLSHLRYEVGTEFGVAWLLAHTLLPLAQGDFSESSLDSQKVDSETRAKLQNALDELDIGYLASESNLAEEELEAITSALTSALTQHARLHLVLGSELAAHSHALAIAAILGSVARVTPITLHMPELEGDVLPLSQQDSSLMLCDELPESNGNFIYILPREFSQAGALPSLMLPALFAPALGLQNEQELTLCFEQTSLKARAQRHPSLKGTIALLTPNPESGLDSESLGYPYKKVEVVL